MKLSSEMTNAEIAELFREVAAVYTLRKMEPFRTQAYISAAASIEQFTTPLKEIWQAGQLEEVPGIGSKFHKYLDELFRTGHIRRLELILRSEPAGMYPLLDIEGIGPKTAYKLATALHLHDPHTAVSKVAAAARAGKIAKLAGFSPVSQRKILQAIEEHGQRQTNRLLLPEAEQIANDVIEYLKKSPAVLEAEALGSLRRRAPTVGDLDIAVKTSEPETVQKLILQFPHLRKVLSAGPKMVIFLHSSGWQVDVKTQIPQEWGSMLQHYTGSKLHNIHLRTYAMSMGLSLSENGIKKGKKLQKYQDEVSFYKALGLEYIPPELREDHGEIEAAKANQIPQLVELTDIRGDLHLHTNLNFPSSHDSGTSSVTEILAKAAQLRYSFIGLSDHNPKHQGLTAAERLAAVRQRNDQIDRETDQFHRHHPDQQLTVYKGLEVDILPNGQLALEDAALELLDYAIVSIHSQFRPVIEKADPQLDPKADPNELRQRTTHRILSGLAHPKAKILGHPTTRRLPTRPEIECDWDVIFQYVAEHHKYLEINSAPDRLDLPSPLIQRAISFGCQFVIDTDSHAASSLDFMKYGVWTARKGWATPAVIANSQSQMEW